MEGNLYFGNTNQPQGFMNQAMATWDGNPEPIVREMLQNCLDAAVKANRSTSEVSFTIRKIPVGKIPGIQAYRTHFDGARKQRAKGTQGGHELRVIKQIEKVLKNRYTKVLFCRDNGIGLNSSRMQRILTEGNTDKGEGGAGAFGIGHLTAFAASDLRYIHYAGRSRSNGRRLQDTASAQAVLASRTMKNNTGRAANGFWLMEQDMTLFNEHPYPNTIPDLLRPEMDRLDETGSVVCVLGFNDFRNADRESSIDAIARVAAKNFMVAIWNGKMVVQIRDEVNASRTTVSRKNLKNILKKESRRRRAEQKGGWLSGEQAFKAWETLKLGRKLYFLENGVGGYFRLLGDGGKSRSQSRVQVFRNGMWITNYAVGLLPKDFNGFRPFDAVLEIDGGKVGDLIRKAEGPEHRKLDLRRLESEDKMKLREKLKDLADRLRREAGKLEVSEEFTPTGFAMFKGDEVRESEKIPAYRPRGSPMEAAVQEDAPNESSPQPDQNKGGGIDPERKLGSRSKKPRKFTPKPGRSVRGRCSVRAIPDQKDHINRLQVIWQSPKGKIQSGNHLFVRVRVPSGSDETCLHPIAPKWLHLSEIQQNGNILKPQGDKFEIGLPQDKEPFTILLADPISDPNAVEVDVVGRRPTEKENSQE